MSVPSVPLNAPREKAQAAAGYNELQWDRFKCLTKAEVIALVKTSPHRKWKDVPANEAIAIKNRINSLLAEEEVPAVRDDVLKWRMASCMQYHSNKTKTIASRESYSIATTDTAAAETQAVGGRLFDPIRDI